MLKQNLIKAAIRGGFTNKGKTYIHYSSNLTVKELIENVDLASDNTISYEYPSEINDVAGLVKHMESIIIDVYGENISWYNGVTEKGDDRFENFGCIEFPAGTQLTAVNCAEKLSYLKSLTNSSEGDYENEIPVVFCCIKQNPVLERYMV